MGHVLSANGISANPEKIEKVKTWPVPKTSRKLNPFLELASYYRQFINKFAKKAQCLHKLVGPTSNKQKKKARPRKNTTTGVETGLIIIEWIRKASGCIWCIKRSSQYCTSTGLSWFLQEFILETDASLNRLGTILSQEGKDGEIHVIAYASHSLCPSERSMHIIYKLLALKWAVMEKFQDYLLGSWFQVYRQQSTCLCPRK